MIILLSIIAALSFLTALLVMVGSGSAILFGIAMVCAITALSGAGIIAEIRKLKR